MPNIEKPKKLKLVNNLPKLMKLKQEQYKAENNADLTEVHMAIQIGVSPVTLSHYKNGKIESVRWDVWQKMVKYFGVPGHEIFDVLLDDEE
jgi:DNA-binding XRE family transcriptional regulator